MIPNWDFACVLLWQLISCWLTHATSQLKFVTPKFETLREAPLIEVAAINKIMQKIKHTNKSSSSKIAFNDVAVLS